MHFSRASRPRSIQFKVTSMIDMTFLLITFFIMSIRFGQESDDKIELPNADQATQVADKRVEIVSINVTKDGSYIVNGLTQSSGELIRYLAARKEEAEKIELVIRGDRATEFNSIQRLMRLSAEHGIPDVSLAALQAPEESN